MQYAASFASIGVIVILIAYTVQSTVHQVNRISPFTASNTVDHTNRLFAALAPAKPVVFVVDKTASQLTWTARKVTGRHTGRIHISDGSLQLDNNILQSGSFALDSRSISVTDLTDAGNNAGLVGHLKSDGFFAADKHPVASFAIGKATHKGNGQYDIDGKLTIKGITHDLKFPATVAVADGKLRAKANVKVDRTQYDIRFRSKRFFENLGDKAISDDFDLDITLVASAR